MKKLALSDKERNYLDIIFTSEKGKFPQPIAVFLCTEFNVGKKSFIMDNLIKIAVKKETLEQPCFVPPVLNLSMSRKFGSNKEKVL